MKIDINFLAYRDSIQTKKDGEKTSIFDPIRGEHVLYTKDSRRTLIFDPIRNKYLEMEKEEIVRQLFIQYLIQEKKYPITRFGIEKKFKLNKLDKRSDILIYDKNMAPFILVECKAPQVSINEKYFQQKTFEQIARYNLSLQVQYLIITNGVATYCCKMDYDEQDFTFVDKIPSWSER